MKKPEVKKPGDTVPLNAKYVQSLTIMQKISIPEKNVYMKCLLVNIIATLLLVHDVYKN
jgi:hypothetical protein